jgi:EmrB/QacA subfamily drug resistance transporter
MAPDALSPRRRHRRWVAFAVLAITLLLAGIDVSVLNVAIPSMLSDLDTTVTSLQWVAAGYSLTIASLLIIGGRLGDIFGYRRLFVIGVSFFGVGALVTTTAQNVPMLLVGKAVLQGVGSALMMPSTLALVSISFHGRERARAFAAWGAVMGVSVCLGPPVGGFLTTHYSWRWAFAMNVVLAPVAVLGGLLFIERSPATVARSGIDVLGAVLASSGVLLVILALTQSPEYGWLRSLGSVTVAGQVVWPSAIPLSPTFAAGAIGMLLLVLFVEVERRKQQRNADPLFDLDLLRIPTFRYGIITSAIFALGQFGLLFCLPLFLQRANGLTAAENGLWLLPMGLALLGGAHLGGRLITWLGTARVVQVGFLIEALALAALVYAVGAGLTFGRVLPILSAYGLGAGFATSQLTNLVLSDVPDIHVGSASGANSTARQIGSALGIAMIGVLLTVATVARSSTLLEGSDLPDAVIGQTVEAIERDGPSWQPPLVEGDASTDPAVTSMFLEGLTTGSQIALGFAACMLLAASLLVSRARRAPGSVLSPQASGSPRSSCAPRPASTGPSSPEPLDETVAAN